MNRRRWLMAVLALTLLLVGWLAGIDDDADDAVDGAVSRGLSTPGPAARPTSVARRSQANGTTDDGLSSPWPTPPAGAVRLAWSPANAPALAAWGPPLSPPAPPPALHTIAEDAIPPVPQPPPLPYTLIGRLEDGGQVMALIAGPTRTLSARTGDILDGQWRIDSIQSNAVTLTWLPANVTQTLGYSPS